MIPSILKLIFITLLPLLELRASIPIGILVKDMNLPWPVVVLVCVITNILLGWAVFWILAPFFRLCRKWSWFDRKIWPLCERTQKRLHPYIEKYGEMGVAIFIGIPLPGTGVYSGAFGAYLLGVDRKKFAVANVLGVLIAGAVVTAICLLIYYGALGQDSWIAKLFLKFKPESIQ